MYTQDDFWPRRSGIVHQAIDNGTSRIYVTAKQERGIAMMNYTECTNDYVELHLRELRAQAMADRLVREARGPRPLRRRMGRLLIALGTALHDQPGDALIPESALAAVDTRT